MDWKMVYKQKQYKAFSLHGNKIKTKKLEGLTYSTDENLSTNISRKYINLEIKNQTT